MADNQPKPNDVDATQPAQAADTDSNVNATDAPINATDAPAVADDTNATPPEPGADDTAAPNPDEAAPDAAAAADDAPGTDADPAAPKTPEAEERQNGYLKRKLAEKDDYIAELEASLETNYVNTPDGDERDKRLRAVEATQLVDRIRLGRDTIRNEFERAQLDIPMFNPSSPEFNAEVYDALKVEYADTFVETIKDARGQAQIAGFKGKSPYQFLSERADLLSKVAQSGARKGQQAESKMRAAAVTPPAASPKGDERSDADLSPDEYAAKYGLNNK